MVYHVVAHGNIAAAAAIGVDVAVGVDFTFSCCC